MADSEIEILAKTARNPSQESRYKELLSQSGLPYIAGGNGMQTSDFQFQAAQALAKAQNDQAMAPILSSLEASKPEISQKFATERQRLSGQSATIEKRYQNLLDEVTRIGGQQVAAAQTGASRELGRRGLSLRGGISDQYIQEKVQPVAEWQTGQVKSLGTERENTLQQLQAVIAGLAPQETEALRNVQNLIAQTQYGGIQSAQQAAMQLLQMKQQQQEAEANRALEIQKMGQSSFNPLDQQMKLAQIAKIQAEISKLSRGGSGGSSSDWE